MRRTCDGIDTTRVAFRETRTGVKMRFAEVKAQAERLDRGEVVAFACDCGSTFEEMERSPIWPHEAVAVPA